MLASPRRPRVPAALLVGLVAAVAAPLACAAPDDGSDSAAQPGPSEVAARPQWSDGTATAAEGDLVMGRVDVVPGTERVVVALRNGAPVAIPRPCTQSNVRTLRSFIHERTLVCVL